MEKLLMTLPDFCGRYSVSRSATYREIAAGRLRVTKRGSRTLIHAEDAETWRKALPTKGADAE